MFMYVLKKRTPPDFIYKLKLFTCGVIAITATSVANAGNLSLAWNTSPSPEVSGYKLYYGEGSKQYNHHVDVGNTTTHMLEGILPGQIYYIAATAYCNDCNGFQESEFSEELEVLISSSGSVNGVIPQDNWSLVYVDSQEVSGSDGRGINAFDGNPDTIWHTEWSRRQPPPPHEIQIDLGSVYELASFRYLPRQDGNTNGWIKDYAFYVSRDGQSWGQPVATGTFPNSAAEQEVMFNSPVTAQFIRLVALNEINGNPWTAVANLSMVGIPFSGNLSSKQILEASAGKMITVNTGITGINGSGVDSESDPASRLLPSVEIGEAIVTHEWQKISFRESFLDPVVVALTFSDASPAPGKVRIRNVTSEDFEIRLQDWEVLDEAHPETQIPFLVMEKGHYTLPNGAKIEAGTLEAEANATFEAVDFLQSFNAPPVVLTSVTSDNDPQPVAVSKHAINLDGFDLRLQRQGAEASAGMEAIDYIAVEPSAGMAGAIPFEVGQAEQITGQAFQTITFLNKYGNPPLVMADFQTHTAGEMTSLHWEEKTAASIKVKAGLAPAEEEADDTAHIIGYIVFGLEE